MLLISIRDIALDLAKRYGLDIWDWVAISITSATLIISFISLFIACRTLKSQRKTEKNTNPDITDNTQLKLLFQIYKSALNAYSFLFALHFQLEKAQYMVKPSNHIWNYIRMPLEYLHEELFYGNEDKLRYFQIFSNVCQQIQNDFTYLREAFDSNEVKVHVSYMTPHAYARIGVFMSSYIECLSKCFDLDEKLVSIFLDLGPSMGFGVSDPLEYLNYQIAYMGYSVDLNNMSDASEAVNTMQKTIEAFIQTSYNAVAYKCPHYKQAYGYEKYSSTLMSYYCMCLNIIVLNTWYNNKPFKMRLDKVQEIPEDLVRVCYFYILESITNRDKTS